MEAVDLADGARPALATVSATSWIAPWTGRSANADRVLELGARSGLDEIAIRIRLADRRT